MEVLVFKTGVSKKSEVSLVRSLLKNIPGILDWNFDLEDCDRILRIVSDVISPRKIETVLQTAGIYCEELEYTL